MKASCGGTSFLPADICMELISIITSCHTISQLPVHINHSPAVYISERALSLPILHRDVASTNGSGLKYSRSTSCHQKITQSRHTQNFMHVRIQTTRSHSLTTPLHGATAYLDFSVSNLLDTLVTKPLPQTLLSPESRISHLACRFWLVALHWEILGQTVLQPPEACLTQPGYISPL